jgi:hypothetical protein
LLNAQNRFNLFQKCFEQQVFYGRWPSLSSPHQSESHVIEDSDYLITDLLAGREETPEIATRDSLSHGTSSEK